MKVVAVLLAVMAAAAPASAAVPEYERFDKGVPTSPLFTATGPPCAVAINTRPIQDYYLQTLCQPTLTLTFARPQAMVEMFATTINGSALIVATAHAGANTVTDT